MAAGQPVPQKKSNTCLILIIIFVLLGFLGLVGVFALVKVVPGLILNKLTGTTQTNQNPLEKFIGGLVGGNNGGGNGLFDGGGGGGLIPGGTGGGTGSKSDDELALEQCVPGKTALGLGVGAGYAYTGKEKFIVGGQNVTLCCLAVYDITQGQTLANAETKMCGDSNETLVYLQKVDGKFVPFMAGYKKDGQDCSQVYDESGSVTSNFCE